MPGISGFFKKKAHFLRRKFCPRQRSCPGQVASSKKGSYFEEKVLPQAAKLPGTSGLSKKTRFSGNTFCPRQRSCPGQVASSKRSEFWEKSSALDKWFGREKANNRCGQGRGAPFGGSGGRSPPASRPPHSIHRPGGRYCRERGLDTQHAFYAVPATQTKIILQSRNSLRNR